MFNFNREVLDRFLLKPIATGWDFVFPDLVQRGIRNMFDNLWVVRRVVNNTLQLKLAGAGTELARFTINSTIGLAASSILQRTASALSRRMKIPARPSVLGAWALAPISCCPSCRR